jgi:adenylosuccinate synthase
MIHIVTGAQWGDEGKAKVVELLSSKNKYDYVVRFSGGANAGHTVVVNGQKRVFHLLPSAIENCEKCFIGSGCVVDVEQLQKEILEFNKKVYLSPKAHIVLNIYKEWETSLEKVLNIGTTKKGIGQAYAMKALRGGVRFSELNTDNTLDIASRVSKILNVDLEKVVENINQIKNILDELISKNLLSIEDLEPEMRSNQHALILLEGAQGVMLDINSETYPYVTSSMTTATGAIAQAGLSWKNGVTSIGIFKPYITKVGEGEFETEIIGSISDHICEVGKEYGSTTGRKRRIGWLNLDQLKEACEINGYDKLSMMKVDVLFGLEKISVFFDGQLKELDGFNTIEDDSFKNLVRLIEQKTNVPVSIISYGPDSLETLVF